MPTTVPSLSEALILDHLVRDEGKDPLAYLDSLEVETSIANTNTIVRWHRIGHSATLDQPDTEKMIDKLILLLVDFACTRKERDEAVLNVQQTGSTQALTALVERARRLFTTSANTGEVGELMLYFLAEHLLKYPQVLCKFPLKTNPNVHAHGADGVHASVDPKTGHLRLHWGEAKLYQKLGPALDDCFSSLSELILEPTGAKKTKRRDVELLRDHIDLNEPGLEKAFRSYLDPDNTLSKKVRYCGLALIGFDYPNYDNLTKQFANQEVAAVSSLIQAWAARIKSSVEKHELIGISIDLFCIPFVSVETFRSAFLKRLG
ncbi:MAG: DUF1837 domain-containing protein [Prosthecobacter sp.]|uniref:HamA C-terminal domain-containing protein n=1 Tax=Prosthecobacter sp. TaxID=1965333 RepID=UPI003BB0EDFA